MFFTRSNGQWSAILESHRVRGRWSKPVVAPFSGEWSDSSPGIAPDGSYIVFVSQRPVFATSAAAEHARDRRVANLWRSDRTGSGWTVPVHLPDAVNIGDSIWKPSIAANGNLYFVAISKEGGKRLFRSEFRNGAYQPAAPLSFSDGTTLDVDPEVAPDESFLVFCSAGRKSGNSLDQLYLVARTAAGWGPVVAMHYAGDDRPAPSTDDEPHLGPDRRRVYFASDRPFAVDYPRTRTRSQQELRMFERYGWFGGFASVWSIPLAPYLEAARRAAAKQGHDSVGAPATAPASSGG
jgi:Tol biopolymer transport system component